MESYCGKLLQLLYLSENEDKPYMYVRLWCNGENIEFNLGLDRFTYNNLRNITGYDEDCYHRISFRSYWDDQRKQFFSILSKVRNGKSLKVCFPCTELFVSNINWLKDLNSLEKIGALLPSDNGNNEKNSYYWMNSITEYVEKIVLRLVIITIFGILFIGYIYSAEVYSPRLGAGTNVENVLSMPKDYTHNKIEDLYSITNIMEKIPSGKSLGGPFTETLKEPLRESLVKLQNTDFSSASIFAGIYGEARIDPQDLLRSRSLDLHVPDVNDKARQLPFYKIPIEQSSIHSLPAGYAALTFDDGPSMYTMQILDILKEHNVGGTFFFIGKNIQRRPDIVYHVYNSGFSIGNHSYSHPLFGRLSAQCQRDEIEETNMLIENIIKERITLFRPPYGGVAKETSYILNDLNMRTVLWNRDPVDWNREGYEGILQYVIDTHPHGGIYLFHETPSTVKALPKIIKYLLEQGLEIVSLK